MGKPPPDPEDAKKRNADLVRRLADLGCDPHLTERLRVLATAYRAANNLPYTSPLPCSGPNCGKRAVSGYFFCSRACRLRYVAIN